jgi:hypothetical protein
MATEGVLQAVRGGGSDGDDARAKLHAYSNVMGRREAAFAESNRELVDDRMSAVIRSGHSGKTRVY